MPDDERAIRDLIAEWQRAAAAGDATTLQGLMDEDVSTAEVQEVQVTGDWAYSWTHLRVAVTPGPEGSPLRRSGYTLTVLRKKSGRWVLFRDANLLAAEP